MSKEVCFCIHEASDIPLRRRLEKAWGWPVMGIKKLSRPPDIDLVAVRMSHNYYEDGVALYLKRRPDEEHKIYYLYFHRSCFLWIKKQQCSGQWKRYHLQNQFEPRYEMRKFVYSPEGRMPVSTLLLEYKLKREGAVWREHYFIHPE